MQLLDANTPLNNTSPYRVGEFTVGVTPVVLRAFGLGADDLVCIESIEKIQVESANIKADGCGIQLPSLPTTAAFTDLLDCGKKICLCALQPWAIIGLSGTYQLKVSGTNIQNKAVTVSANDYAGFPHELLTYCKTCGNP